MILKTSSRERILSVKNTLTNKTYMKDYYYIKKIRNIILYAWLIYESMGVVGLFWLCDYFVDKRYELLSCIVAFIATFFYCDLAYRVYNEYEYFKYKNK